MEIPRGIFGAPSKKMDLYTNLARARTVPDVKIIQLPHTQHHISLS